MNYYKKRIVIVLWSIFTPSAVICLLNGFFSKLCGKKRQQFLFCGQRTEEFIKLFPNKEIISDKIQLALKR